MIVQAVNSIKNTTVNQQNKYSKYTPGNNKTENPNIKYSNGIYGKTQVELNRKNNPSFGVIGDLFLALLQGVGLSLATTAAMSTLVYIVTLPDEKREKEARRLLELRKERIENLEKTMNLNYTAAEKYHDDFLLRAYIPATNNGHEIGLNAVMGYGVEKYKAAIDFILPIITRGQHGVYPRTPNGMLLYGPPGGGKTYMAEKICEHVKYFGINVIKVDLKERGHAKNAERIKKAFDAGKEYYKKTGTPTVIYFPQDIDNYLIDRKKAPEYIKEVRAMLNSAENCGESGVSWIGTANYSQNIDPAILRPGRTDIKLAIGEMEDFAIADMLKYVLYKVDEKDSAENFDFQKVVDKIKEEGIAYTPAELELFVKDAKKHNPYPENFLTAELVMQEIDYYNEKNEPTLTPEMLEKFKQDQEYIKNLDQKTLENAQQERKKATEKKEMLEAKSQEAKKILEEAEYDLNKAKEEEDQAKANEHTLTETINTQNKDVSN